ncbi:MAG: hypothetical protein ACREJC_19050, partial [Tepidisphaeraceae bacterium]
QLRGRVLLCDTEHDSRFVKGTADQYVKVISVERRGCGFNLVFQQLVDDGVQYELAQVAFDPDGVTLHEKL